MDGQQRRRTVVVGIDGSESARQAARWGAAEAERRGIPLRLVIAFSWPREHGRPQRGKRYRDVLLARSREHLAEAAAGVEREAPGVVVEQQLIVGSPIPVLGGEARRAQLVVIGDRGLGRVEGLLVGSVAVALAANASCPVVVVRGAAGEPSESASRPILVGIDGTATSEAAIAFAFEAAAARGVPLVAVHTWSDMVFDPSTAAVVIDWDAVESAERELLSQLLAGWSGKYPDVPVEQVITCDRPAQSLLEHAIRAQLVVVGSRGHCAFAGMVLGSVSNAVLHRSPCPVAVVRSSSSDSS